MYRIEKSDKKINWKSTASRSEKASAGHTHTHARTDGRTNRRHNASTAHTMHKNNQKPLKLIRATLLLKFCA